MNLYRFYIDFEGTEIDSLFITSQDMINELVGSTIFIDDGNLEFWDVADEDITLISEDQDFVAELKRLFNNNTTICGINPLYLIEDEDSFEEDEEDIMFECNCGDPDCGCCDDEGTFQTYIE